jgi:lysophospholipase L1-like esterase
VTREQESVAAHEPNSSYFDVAPRMGSVQSMRAQGLMLSDNLHLTPAGYKKLGAIIADGIARSM